MEFVNSKSEFEVLPLMNDSSRLYRLVNSSMISKFYKNKAQNTSWGFDVGSKVQIQKLLFSLKAPSTNQILIL